MDGACVAVQNDISDVFFRDQLGKPIRPIFGGAIIGDIALTAQSERAVPGVEPHTPNRGPGPLQHLPQLVKKWSMRSLKKQKDPVEITVALHRIYLLR